MNKNIAQLWLFFKRGMTNINFLISLFILFSVREFNIQTMLLIWFMLPLTIIVGWVDYNHVSERNNPKLNPYIQDYLKSVMFVNNGLMLLCMDEKELAYKCFDSANGIISEWYQGEIKE